MAGDRVGTTFGPYRIDDLIGRGGMGEVYRAYDTVKDREVALKLLPRELAKDASYRERFQREARVAARLQEPHVIPIHDFGEIDDILFMDMRLVRGKDLRAVLRRPDHMDVAFAVEVARQVADALEAAHTDGLVHRDVKPENILLLPSGFAYLADFGIASRSDEVRLTSTGTAIGSFAYMAPERFQDEPVGPATDIYSLGCVLYECLAGEPPFPRSSVPSMIQAHLNDAPRRLTSVRGDVPPALEKVIARAMAKDPAQRFGTAHEFGRAATAALEASGQTARSAGAGVAAAGTATAKLPKRSPAALTGGAPTGTSRPHSGPAFTPRRPTGTHSRTTNPPPAERPGRKLGPAAALWAVLAALGLVAAFAAWQVWGQDDGTGALGADTPDRSSPSSGTTSSTGPSSTSSLSTSPSSPTSTSTSVSTRPDGKITTVTVTHTGSSTTTTSASTQASSREPTTSTSTDTSTSTPTSPTSPTIAPGAGYDSQGWTSHSQVRCSGGDRAVLVASSDSSLVTICEAPSGSRYYLGLRPDQTEKPNNLRVANPVRESDGWRANSGGYVYKVTPSMLYISNSSGTLRDEAISTYVEPS